jgi:hypothetical protein
MKLNIRLLALSIVLMGISQSAKAEIGVMLGYNMWSPSFSVPTAGVVSTVSGKGGFLGGLSYTASLVPMIGLEIDGLYVTRKADLVLTGLVNQTQTFSQNVIEIPVLLRLHLMPLISVGVGPYFALGMGNVTVNGTSESYSAAGVQTSDFGGVASVQLGLPLGLVKLSLDARYVLGMKEQSTDTSTNSEKNREIQILAGLKFGM